MDTQLNPEPEFYLPIYFEEPPVERGPCPRNREIFHAVRLEHLTHREVAAKFQLSNGRIGQIVAQVEDWIARTGGGPTRTWGERARLSEYVHRQRLERVFEQAQSAWKNSRDPHTTRITIVDGKEKSRAVTLKPSQGDVKYLEMSLKAINAMQAFEDGRERPPIPEEMTADERLREAGVVAAEAVRAVKAEAEARQKADAEQMTNDQGEMTNAAVGQVGNLPGEEVAAEIVVEAVVPEVSYATEEVAAPPAEEVVVPAAVPNTSRLETRSTEEVPTSALYPRLRLIPATPCRPEPPPAPPVMRMRPEKKGPVYGSMTYRPAKGGGT